MLSAVPDLGWSVGVDLGGTKLVAGLVDELGVVHGERRREHAEGSGYATMLDDLAGFVGELRVLAAEQGRAVTSVGVAVAAFLTADRSRVRQAANLGWDDQPLADDLTLRLGLPVTLENDADAAAWGEWRFGAGRGQRCLLLVTLGTGVGGGIVHDGRLVSGGNGLGGEIGHLQVEPGGRPCPCGAKGCLEQYASGSALGHVGRQAAAREPSRAEALLELAAGDPRAITGAMVAAAAQRGDRAAAYACRRIGGWLGVGLAQAAALLDPSLILIGGGASTAGDLILEEARRAFAANVGVRAARPEVPIGAAQLGNAAGLVGVADLARAAVAEPRVVPPTPSPGSAPTRTPPGARAPRT
jgi:glucokinase